MKVTMIGAGNLGWHLAKAFETGPNKIEYVYSRNKANAQSLCNQLYHAQVAHSLDLSQSHSELFVVCVPDQAIEAVGKQLILPKNAILVHTSGSVPISVFSNREDIPTGVFYPVQTFTKGKPVAFKNIPICIEASDTETERKLEKLAFTICDTVCIIGTEDRMKLHLAAVFACNFSNHCITLAKQMLEENGLSFDIIRPLIDELMDKSLQMGPLDAQTGPAIRNDTNTIDNHLKILKDKPVLQELYRVFTHSIQKTHRVL